MTRIASMSFMLSGRLDPVMFSNESLMFCFSALDKMTGLKLVKFELHVNDVKTREELKKDDDKQVS